MENHCPTTDDIIKIPMKPFTIKFLYTLLIISLLPACSPYTKGQPIQKDLPAKFAYLVIDIQEDFMNANGKLPIDQGQSPKIIKNINELLPIFEQQKIEIIYIGNEFNKSETIANWFRNNAAIAGSKGTQLAAGLKVLNHHYFPKNHPDAFSNQEFDQYLRKQNITGIIISGVFADQCVLSTVKGALNREYEVFLISGTLGAKTDENLNNALQKYHKLDVSIFTPEQIVNKISL
ncbi:MAG: cysteine hydrolase [Proteobacteria bacterium]|nr:cysteine hydrolase [Pseudomonadota bacterium]MBU1714632.1 cysteine hydrolase [Pseudomonadota bacterium]